MVCSDGKYATSSANPSVGSSMASDAVRRATTAGCIDDGASLGADSLGTRRPDPADSGVRRTESGGRGAAGILISGASSSADGGENNGSAGSPARAARGVRTGERPPSDRSTSSGNDTGSPGPRSTRRSGNSDAVVTPAAATGAVAISEKS